MSTMRTKIGMSMFDRTDKTECQYELDESAGINATQRVDK